LNNRRISICVALTLGATLVTAAAASAQGNNDKFPVFLDHSLTASSEDTTAPGTLWQGAGNPNTTFQRKTNDADGIELGIKAIMRQGPDIRSTYVDGTGLVHIVVPAGSQTTPAPNANRAAWNFTYSYNVTLNPGNPTLADYEAKLWIDLDPSDKVRYLKLALASGGPISGPEPDLNGYQWKSGSTVVIGDDEGTAKVTQNSQNYAFYAGLIDGDPMTPGLQPYTFTPGQFDVLMAIRKKGGDWTILHVVFDVVP